MSDILELLIIIVTAVALTTATYHMLPFRKWRSKKPVFTFFPKYVVNINRPLSEIHSSLEMLGFRKDKSGNYTRGKVYGDFSAKALKLTVEINESKQQVKVYASFFGVLFDTGDLWQVTADITGGE